MSTSILFLAETLGLGGTPKHLAELAPRLMERGLNVSIWNFSRAERYYQILLDQGVPVVLKQRVAPDLTLYLRQHPDTIVHSYLFANHLADVWQTRLVGNLYIMSTRNSGHWRTYTAVESLKLGLRRKLVRHHLTNSEQAKAYLVNKEHIDPARITVIPNGIEDHLHGWPRVERSDLGLSPSDFVLIVVQRLKRVKNSAYLFHQLAKLNRQLPDLKLIIVGYGEEKPLLMKLAAELNVLERCRFLGYQENPYPFIRISDVCISSSLSEGMSNSLLEAAMMGLPTLAHHSTHADIVIDGETGYLFDATDPSGNSFAQTLTRLYSDRQLARRLGGAARTRYQTHFTLDLQVERFIHYYQSLGD